MMKTNLPVLLIRNMVLFPNSEIRIELDKLVKNVSEIGYKYEYTDKTVDFIYGKVSEELEYGARPFRRAIQENIEDKITDEILDSEELEQGHVFNLESQY